MQKGLNNTVKTQVYSTLKLGSKLHINLTGSFKINLIFTWLYDTSKVHENVNIKIIFTEN